MLKYCICSAKYCICSEIKVAWVHLLQANCMVTRSVALANARVMCSQMQILDRHWLRLDICQEL
jgi:hypothetical protein